MNKIFLAVAVFVTSALGLVAQVTPMPVNNPMVPRSMKFAGETVDFTRVDMFERMDRELTQIAFSHNSTMLAFKRANKYFPILERVLREHDIPTDFVYLATIESTLNYRALSSAKAAGLWQLLAGTARELGLEVNDEVDERYDPEISTVAACKYLRRAHNRYGHWVTVAASYNGGMGRITGELEKQNVDLATDLYLNEETTRYPFRILAMKYVMENARKFTFVFQPEQLYQPVDYTITTVEGSVESWPDWAQEHGITYAQLRELNPWIISKSLRNKAGKTYRVRLPKNGELTIKSRKKAFVYNKEWVVPRD